MALSQSALANLLSSSLVPVQTEAEAIHNFSGCWSDYFSGASVNGVLATLGSYAAGLTALEAAMVGVSAPGAAATQMAAAITAFWGAIAALPTAIWVTAPVVLVPPISPPPGLSGLQVALQAAFDQNVATRANRPDAMARVAAALHTSGGVGALVSGSVPPAPPAPLPVI